MMCWTTYSGSAHYFVSAMNGCVYVLIILEGTDGAGKSYIADQLIRYINTQRPGDLITIWHEGPPISHPLDEYELPLLSYKPHSGHHIICDRWHIGELIYPKILGRPSYMDDVVTQHINMFLASKGAIIVHVDANDTLIAERLQVRGDDLVSAAQAVAIAQVYRHVMHTITHTSTISIINESSDSINQTVARIIVDAQTADDRSQLLAEFPTYVGAHHPKYLIINDMHDDPDAHQSTFDEPLTFYPACMPYPRSFSHILLSHLPTWCINTCGIVSANAINSIDSLKRLWFILNEPIIITIGYESTRLMPWAHIPIDPIYTVYDASMNIDPYIQYAQHIQSTIQAFGDKNACS